MKTMNSLHKKLKKDKRKKKAYKTYNKQLDSQLHETNQVLFKTEECLLKLNIEIDEMQKKVDNVEKLNKAYSVLKEENNKLRLVLATTINEQSRDILYNVLTLCIWFGIFYIIIMFCNTIDLINDTSMNTVNMVMVFTFMCIFSFYFSTRTKN